MQVKRRIGSILLAIAAVPAFAQSGPSYSIASHTFNAGGHPDDGVVPASASFVISLDSVGDAISPGMLSSTSYSIHAGFAMTYGPPGRVDGLVFDDDTSMRWNVARAAGTYNLYREGLDTVALATPATCLEPAVPAPMAFDVEEPATGDGFYYLVTARNLLLEESASGSGTSGVPRPFTPCP